MNSAARYDGGPTAYPDLQRGHLTLERAVAGADSNGTAKGSGLWCKVTKAPDLSGAELTRSWWLIRGALANLPGSGCRVGHDLACGRCSSAPLLLPFVPAAGSGMSCACSLPPGRSRIRRSRRRSPRSTRVSGCRYGTPMTSWRPPVSQSGQDELAIAYARDGYALLEAVYDSAAPGWLRELPGVEGTMHQAASHGARRARYRGVPKTPCRTW